jgi:glycosyltransferase involved in cell wall biosynthesis
VLIEAMACGTPVVATDCPGGSHEILEGGRFGQLIEPGDSSALSKAIGRVLKADSLERPNVVERAEFFEESKAVDAYLEAMGLPKWNLSSKKQHDGSGVISCVG